MKAAFAKELSRRLIEYYGRMPSASVVSRDFNLRISSDLTPISQETARRWMRSLSLPELEKMQILVEWLGLDLTFLNAKSPLAAESESGPLERRGKGAILDPNEAYLLRSYKETDARGKHCLLSLAKALHERPHLVR